jgi:hypothetical protein
MSGSEVTPATRGAPTTVTLNLRRNLPFAALLLALTLALAACGSGSSNAKGSGEKATAKSTEPNFIPRPHHDSGGGAEQYKTKDGANPIQNYGAEPSSSEFEAAARVMHEYFDARAVGAWEVACERLTRAISEELVRQLAGESGEEHTDCAAVLADLTAGFPAAALKEAAIADAGALRVEGDSGFLLFRGRGGKEFFIPMHREGGRWKVAAVATSPLS